MALTFDATYYLTARPDVFNAFVATGGKTGQTWAQFAEAHYNTYGRFEGANPNATFNTLEYLTANPDVAAAGVNPFTHYLQFGVNEGRAPSDTFPKFATFDSAAYLTANPDLATAGITTANQAYAHFVVYGQFESRPGAPLIDTGVPGTTYTLQIGEDRLTGTVRNDTFNAPAVQDAAGAIKGTLDNVDILDGGDGVDTLNATIVAATTPVLKNIENVNLRYAAAVDVDLKASTGIKAIKVENSTAAASVKGVGSVATLTVANQLFDATFAGNTAAALNLTLDTVGKTGAANVITLDTGAKTLNLSLKNTVAEIATLESVETLTVDAIGANTIKQLSGAATTSATVTGTGSVNLQTAFTALKTLDASKNAGGVTATVDDDAVTVTTGAGKDSITYTAALKATAKVDLGAGDDTFTIAAASASGAKVDGGAGTNTLKITDGAFLNANAKSVYSNFQVLEIGGGKATYNLDNITGVTGVTIGAALVADAVVSNAAAATTLAVNATKATNLDIAKNLDLSLKDATGKADAISLALNAVDGDNDVTAEGLITIPQFTADGVETFNISSTITGIDATLANTGYTNTITALKGDALATINVTGNANLTVTDKLASTTVTKIDASTATGKLSISAEDSAQSVTFLGGAADDTYKGSAFGDTIKAGKGADAITLGATAGAIDTLIFSAGDSALNAKANGHDTIASFGTAAGAGPLDIIDLGAFGFTGQKSSALANKGAIAASVVDGSTLTQADFFNAAGIDRGVAIGTNGGNTYVFVDVDGNGDFNADADLFIQLTGVTDVTLANFGF